MHKDYIDTLIDVLHRTQYYQFDTRIEDYEQAMQDIISCFNMAKEKRQQVFFVGNGGSSAIASHMTADFMKNGGMKTYSLYDNAVTTCMGNDYGYEYVFSRPLSFLGNSGDLLVAISSSGKSKNILNAIQVAKKKKMKVVTFTGFEFDNPSRKAGDYNVYVPINHYGIVESIHNIILQQIVDAILERDGETL